MKHIIHFVFREY